MSLAANGDDGIMTALEISELRLLGTNLVVLSACETGTGEISQSEGVFGLRQAFQLGGAQTVIMSLWFSRDTETVSVMADFYGRLKAGAGKAQTLRRSALAQLEARRERFRVTHPSYWSGFVSFGSPGQQNLGSPL
jgi:CHAT domain-containing protein